MEEITIDVELTKDEALALAQFVKRVGFSELRQCAVSDDEAYEIQSAISAIKDALARHGFSPR